jgi:hypothetical protein
MTQPLNAGSWSPDVGNLMLGRGVILLQPQGDSGFYDVGNSPALNITPKVDTLEHYDAQAQSLSRDALFATKKSIEIKMDLEELTAKNMAMLFMGAVDTTNVGTPQMPLINLMLNDTITGHFKFFGTNTRGPRYYVDLPNVTFIPGGDFSPITENKLAVMSLTGSVNFIGGVWGTAQLQPPIATIVPENIYAPFISTDNACAVGDTLTCQIGVWAGLGISFAYNWQVDGSVPGAGATTTNTYVPVVADEGKTVTCTVTGTNLKGNLAVTTIAYGPVTAY